MATQPSGVSFLICTFNGTARIDETLTCLAHQANPQDLPWEVILVDNASTDNTAELAKQIWKEHGSLAPLHVLYEPRSGKQYALELATNQAQYCYTCIVDDDNRLAPDYLQIGFDLLEANAKIGVLGGQNTATFEGTQPEWFPAFQHCYAVGKQMDYASGQFKPLLDGNVGRNVLWGAGMFVRTTIWHQLSEVGFQSLFSGRQGEANLTAGEDDELCYVAQLLGYEVWYSSQLHLQHHMAAGRLTVAYRDRLFYASARSTTRLNAYRNALWGKKGASIDSNLLKDIAYSAVGILKEVCSPAFMKAAFTGNTIQQMKQVNALVVIKDALLHFRQVKTYYERVIQLKRQVGPIVSSSQPQEKCTK